MIRRLAILVVAILVAAGVPARAQTVEAQRFRLAVGPCVISSGAGAPSASTGNSCDSYFDTGSGDLWVKIAGVWKRIGDIGSGTPGTVAKWATTSTLQDSAIKESGGAAIVSEAIGSPGYASQVSGWQITQAGAADVRYLFTDELRARLFTADNEAVLAGSQRVTKSYSTIAVPFTCPAGSSASQLQVFDAATFANAPVFQVNDWIVIHTMTRTTLGPFTISECVGSVTGYTDGTGATEGQQSWTFTRGAGASGGSMTAGTVVAVNQLAQDLGVSGNGYVETTALDGANNINAPYMQVVTWTTAPTGGNLVARCRYGNLAGIVGTANEYGFFCGDFTGPGHFVRLSNVAAEIRDIPVNLLDAAGTKVLSLDPSGPSFAIGNPIPTGYAAAIAGLWAGRDTDGTYKFRVGDPNGQRLVWDGASLLVFGNGNGITNINGGNIQTNSITVGQINATGFGDNLIKNGTFEGNPTTGPDPLAGWILDFTAGGSISQGCCGLRGPGTGLISVTGGATPTAAALDYMAVPVQSGTVYRVAFDVYSAAAGPGLYVRMQQCAVGGATQIKFCMNDGTATGNMTANAPAGGPFYTDLCGNCTLTAGWQHLEYTYNPPAGVQWVSLMLLDYSCIAAPSNCSVYHFDAVEMQPQIGAGHILAGSITADRIKAHAITAAQILAGTITTTELGAGSVTATQIAANAVTTASMQANSINGDRITGGTIVAGKLSVGSLDTITATMGHMTSGTIDTATLSSATITTGNISALSATAGCATFNSNGISLSTPSGANCNWYKWGGSSIGMSWDGGQWMTLGGINVQIKQGNSGLFVAGTSGVGIDAAGPLQLDAHGNSAYFQSSGFGSLNLDGNGMHLYGPGSSYIYLSYPSGYLYIQAANVNIGSGVYPLCMNSGGYISLGSSRTSC